MTSQTLIRVTLALAAASLVLLPVSDASASKEKFVRDKPHVNATDEAVEDVAAAEESEQVKDTKIRKTMQELKNTAAADNDVEKKTNKGEAARSRKPDD